MSLLSDKIKLQEEIVKYRGMINDPDKIIKLNAMIIELQSVGTDQQYAAMEKRLFEVRNADAQVYDIKLAGGAGGGACKEAWCSVEGGSDGPINIESTYLPHEILVPVDVPPSLISSGSSIGAGRGGNDGLGGKGFGDESGLGGKGNGGGNGGAIEQTHDEYYGWSWFFGFSKSHYPLIVETVITEN